MDILKLLLVDDEERFLATTQTLLERRGTEVTTAANGFDAMVILKRRPIDVVVLDLKMPGKDGITFLREIKEKCPHVEVILLTGHATVETAVQGLKMGAFDYLVKPCDVTALLSKAQAAHAKKRLCEEEAKKAKIEKIISHPMAVFDED